MPTSIETPTGSSAALQRECARDSDEVHRPTTIELEAAQRCIDRMIQAAFQPSKERSTQSPRASLGPAAGQLLNGALLDKPDPSAPIDVASYNMYYKSGESTFDEIEQISKTHDIFGLQEVQSGNTVGQVVGNTIDTHHAFVGTAQNGPHDGEHSPIFYNKDRYDAVATESVQLHGEDFNGEGGPGRVANFVLLKDKQDGSTVLVCNTHWSNTSEAAREHSRNIIEDKIKAFQEDYPVDGVIVLGDFNTNTPNVDGVNGTTEGSTHDSGWTLDHILTGQNIDTSRSEVLDGGDSDHHIVSKTVQIKDVDDDERKDSLQRTNLGAVAYQHAGFGGRAWIIGYGTDPGEGWNDSITSIKVGDSTSATVKEHSENDERFSTDNRGAIAHGDVHNVGQEWNDQISWIQLATK